MADLPPAFKPSPRASAGNAWGRHRPSRTPENRCTGLARPIFKATNLRLERKTGTFTKVLNPAPADILRKK
jgi:hypothetical protein